MGDAFHVVCHECPEEGVYDSRSRAESACDSHTDETDHNVTMLDISPVAPNP